MNISTTVILAMVFMGGFIFAAIFIGLHFSKKSAEKLRKQREQNTEK